MAATRRTALYPEFFEGANEAFYAPIGPHGWGTEALSDAAPSVRLLRGLAGSRLMRSSLSCSRRRARCSLLGFRPGLLEFRFVVGESIVDAVAAYFPWHFFDRAWRIRIYEGPAW